MSFPLCILCRRISAHPCDACAFFVSAMSFILQHLIPKCLVLMDGALFVVQPGHQCESSKSQAAVGVSPWLGKWVDKQPQPIAHVTASCVASSIELADQPRTPAQCAQTLKPTMPVQFSPLFCMTAAADHALHLKHSGSLTIPLSGPIISSSSVESDKSSGVMILLNSFMNSSSSLPGNRIFLC